MRCRLHNLLQHITCRARCQRVLLTAGKGMQWLCEGAPPGLNLRPAGMGGCAAVLGGGLGIGVVVTGWCAGLAVKRVVRWHVSGVADGRGEKALRQGRTDVCVLALCFQLFSSRRDNRQNRHKTLPHYADLCLAKIIRSC
jgi:hypothetical protein